MLFENRVPPGGIVLELHYLPTLEYFTTLLSHGVVRLEGSETFQKQSGRNRCQILTAQGVDTLIVPVQEGRSKIPIREARIDYGQPWINRHWRAIRTAYGKAPFFEHYGKAYEAVFQKKPAFLFDLNLELLTICLRQLNWTLSITVTERYEETDSQVLRDARGLIHPKRDFTERRFYRPVPYYQTFGEQFFPNLSILDLLFNLGPRATDLLRQSVAAE